MQRILLNKLLFSRLIKNGNSIFVTFLVRWVQFTFSHSLYLKSILILPFHLCLGIPSDLSYLGFLSVHLDSVRMFTTCTAHHKLLNLNTLITRGEGYKSWASSLRTFLRPRVQVFFVETSWPRQMDSAECHTANRLMSWRRAWHNSGQRLLLTE